jgi:sodium-dependent phosphate transporter
MSYQNGLTSCNLEGAPNWILPSGGFAVCLGVCLMGHKVIQTMGFNLSNINFLRGFCIEFGSMTSVVLATVLGLPVSTTHCQVGAVVFVGWTAFGRKHVQWRLLSRIVVTWVLTLPVAGGLSAAILAASGYLMRR